MGCWVGLHKEASIVDRILRKQGFEHILEAVDAQQMFRCEKTSAEADWLFGEKEAK